MRAQGCPVPADLQGDPGPRRHPPWGVWFDATAVPEEKWQGPYLPYLNRYLACGIDLRKEPVEIAPAAHTSCGGVWIDECCETGIPGLLACGEVAGGLHGANRLGGNAGLETMVFGRICGQQASLLDPSVVLPDATVSTPDVQSDVDTGAMRDALRGILRKYLNVVRDADHLPEAETLLDALDAQLGEYCHSYEKYRLHNDILTAKLLLKAAMARKTSVGCHVWETEGEPEEPYRVVLRSQDGEIAVTKEKL